MDDQTLELQIKSNMEQAKGSIDGIVNQLLSMSGAITNVSTKIDANGKLTLKSLTTVTKEGDKLVRTFQKVDKVGNLKLASSSARILSENIKNAGNNAAASTPKFSKMTNVLSKFLTVATARKIGNVTLDFFKEGIDRTEQLNLFNVVFDNIEKNGVQTFSTLGKEATQFQYKLKEAFGTNMTETLKYQALFRSMGDNVGIPDNPSSLMAETMSKFTYDLASLYNQEESNVAEALRAGVYAGQTKPLRSYGIDVTQQSMQPILDELGIERSVKQLSQAEKEILRYITALRQGQVAMGDFANTVESPSNQLKVFRQQLVEAKTNLTALFIGSFQKILPYANAILMVVSEVSKAIADMFGIKLSDYNSGIASQEGAYEDLEDQIDDTAKATEELKRKTLGFDEIHNIDENKDNGSGELTGGIDKRLLDAIKGYDNGMDKVRMKATEIRDRIMEWLGFHKEIDPLTGETIFKLNDGKTVFKTMWDWLEKIWGVGKWFFNNIGTILTAFITYKTIDTLGTVFSKVNDLVKLVKGNSALQLGITVSVSYVIAEEISKSDKYQGLAKFLSGNALGNDGDYTLNNMWGEILKGNPYKLNEEDVGTDTYNSFLDILKNLYIREKKGLSVPDQVDDYIKRYEQEIEEYKSAILAKLQGANLYTGEYTGRQYALDDEQIEIFKGRIAGYEDAKETIEQWKKANPTGNKLIGDDNGVNIETYSEALKNYFSTYLDGVTSLDKYTEAVQNSQTAHENACTSVALLVEAITKPDYKLTKKDMDDLTTSLTNMEDSVQKKGKDTVTAIDKITQKYVERGLMSKEEADQIVRDAERVKLAEEGHTKEYIDEVTKLQKKLDDGKISQSKFKEELMKLDKKYNDSSTVVGSFVDKLELQNDTIDFSAENMDSIKESIKGMASEHEAAAKTIETSSNNNRKVLEQYAIDAKKEYGEDSEAYALAVKAIKASDDERTQSIADVDEAYKNYLLNIVANMYESGDLMSADAKETKDLINEELKKLGVDIDLTKNMDDIAKQLEMNGVKVGGGITFDESNVKNKIFAWTTKIGSWAQSYFNKNPIELTMNGSVKTVTFAQAAVDKVRSLLGLAKADGGAFYGGTWHNIQQYANGGVPSHGTVFVGGEHGPEIAGHINGRTEILNQSQLASVMYSAVVNGMSQVMSQYAANSSQGIRVYAEEGIIVEKVAKGFDESVKQTGSLPFTIP